MISILKLADEESCMYMKCLAIQVCTYIHTQWSHKCYYWYCIHTYVVVT